MLYSHVPAAVMGLVSCSDDDDGDDDDDDDDDDDGAR